MDAIVFGRENYQKKTIYELYIVYECALWFSIISQKRKFIILHELDQQHQINPLIDQYWGFEFHKIYLFSAA